MSIKGSPYARSQRSLQAGKLSVVLTAAAELQAIQLAELEAEIDERFPFDELPGVELGESPAAG